MRVALGRSRDLLPRVAIASALGGDVGFIFTPSSLRLVGSVLCLGAECGVPSGHFRDSSQIVVRPVLSGGDQKARGGFSPVICSNGGCSVLLQQKGIYNSQTRGRCCSHFTRIVSPSSVYGRALACTSSYAISSVGSLCAARMHVGVDAFYRSRCQSAVHVAGNVVCPVQFFGCGLDTVSLSGDCVPGRAPLGFGRGKRVRLHFHPRSTGVCRGRKGGTRRLEGVGGTLSSVSGSQAGALAAFRVVKCASPRKACRCGLGLTGGEVGGTRKGMFRGVSRRAVQGTGMSGSTMMRS